MSSPSLTSQSITLHNRANRRDVWNVYWFMWSRGLWLRWLFIAVAVFIAVFVFERNEGSQVVHASSIAAAAVLAVLTFLVAYPQLAFKPRDRTFTASASGIDTTIGEMKAHRDWSEIGSVTDMGDFISLIVERTSNAFTVPNHAFDDISQRSAFLTAVKHWQATARV